MENQDLAYSHHSDASRPSLGFPLGTALLLIIVFTLSGLFSCCYHRDKLRSFRRRRSHPTDLDLEEATHDGTKAKPTLMGLNETEKGSLTVLMPGDQVPKFIAMPCPCQPPRPANDVVFGEVQNSTKLPPHGVVHLS